MITIREGPVAEGGWGLYGAEKSGKVYVVFACPKCKSPRAHEPDALPRGRFLLVCACGYQEDCVIDGLPPRTLQ